MRTLKTFIIITILGLFSISMNSCNKCKGEDPAARIINNGTSDASVQIKTSGGNTININNVATGTSSDYSSYASGEVTFTITVAQIDYVEIVTMSECTDYDIAIDNNNNITTEAVDRK
jgi:hypothetical protein